MKSQKKTQTFLFLVVFGIFLATFAVASDPLETTPVEHESQWWPKDQDGGLGTIRYRPSKSEQPFFDRLSGDEIVTGSQADSYDITTKDKKYVGWFGIVRKIDEDTSANHTALTVEHKYFDGLTDAYLQAVSFNGSGDFRVTLKGTGHRIPPLSLVKVYGIVVKGKEDAPPRIDAVFVRNWHWGTFVFLAAYGTQHGSEEWRNVNQIALDEIHEAWPHPCHQYYETRLGKRPDAAEIRKRLLDAAGPLSAGASQAMERLAALLALGHPWSPPETQRQSEEFRQIGKLVGTTGSRKAAIDLLLQALHENDERVSWSASGTFADFDLAGNAIGTLDKLLAHKNPRVRAGAARALSSGYGDKAAPAVAALSRCVSEMYPDLKEYAIRALADIGPSAKSAVPALKNALHDEEKGARVNVAKALWCILQQPDEVIPIFAAVLENGDSGERYEAAEQLKEMGSLAALAVPALIKALTDEEWTTRSNAAEALGEIGSKATTAVPALIRSLQHDDNFLVQANAAQALGKIGDPKAIPILIAALKNEDDSVRFNAITAIETFGPKAKEAVPALIQTVQNDEANGWGAAKALGTVDVEGISSPVLIDAIGDKNSTMRRFAAYGLQGIGRKAVAAEKALRDGLRDSDPGVRVAAAAAYWSITGKTEDAVRTLQSALQTADDWAAQMWAADALAEIGPAAKAAVPDLMTCLKSDTRYVVTSSAKALGKIGPDAAAAVPVLTAQLEKSDDRYTCVCIAHALWRINGSDKSLPVLRDTLKNSRDFMAVSAAAEAIGEMGPQAVASASLLAPLLKNGNSFVREAAAKAIKQIEQK
jgi:HEAT repeat protein